MSLEGEEEEGWGHALLSHSWLTAHNPSQAPSPPARCPGSPGRSAADGNVLLLRGPLPYSPVRGAAGAKFPLGFPFPVSFWLSPMRGVQPCQPRRCREETPFPKCQTVEVRQCRTSPPGKRGLGCSVGSSQLPKTFSCQMNTTHAITHAGRGQPPALPTPRAPCAHLHGIRAAHAMGLHGRGFSMATFTQQQSPHFHGEYLISSKLAVLSTCCPSNLELAPTCIYFTLNVYFSAAITSLPVGFWLAFFPSLTFSFRLPFFFQCKWKIHQRTPAMNSPFPMGKAALS